MGTDKVIKLLTVIKNSFVWKPLDVLSCELDLNIKVDFLYTNIFSA